MKVRLLKYLTKRAIRVNSLRCKYKVGLNTSLLPIEHINIIVPKEGIDLNRVSSLSVRGMDYPLVVVHTQGERMIGSRKIDPNLTYSAIYGNKRLYYAVQAGYKFIECVLVSLSDVNKTQLLLESHRKENNIHVN